MIRIIDIGRHGDAITVTKAIKCFTRLDANHDRQLDAAWHQLVSRMPAHTEQRFHVADMYLDGHLDEMELTAHAERLLSSLQASRRNSNAQ